MALANILKILQILFKSKPLVQHRFFSAAYHRVAKVKVSAPSPPKRKCDLSNKVAIVTGGADGIGLAISKHLLENNVAGLTIADNSKDKGVDCAKSLQSQFGSRILYLDCDVSKSKAFDKVFKETQKVFECVNLVINNAGVMNDVNWEGQLVTNLKSSIVGSLLGMQYMSKTCFGYGGTIINMSSIMGLIPSAGYPIHTLTQYGIVGFSRAMGCESHYERTGVKVMTICPGLTNTKLLRQAPYHAINDKFRKEFKEESTGCVCQRPESVACGMLEILDEARSGSVWVMENNSAPYEIRFPEVADMRMKNKC